MTTELQQMEALNELNEKLLKLVSITDLASCAVEYDEMKPERVSAVFRVCLELADECYKHTATLCEETSK